MNGKRADDSNDRPTISHYPALRDPEQRDKILEKLGEGGGGVELFQHCDDVKPHSRVKKTVILEACPANALSRPGNLFSNQHST